MYTTEKCDLCKKSYSYNESKLILHLHTVPICDHIVWTCPKKHSFRIFVNRAKVKELLENPDWFASRPDVHLEDPPDQLVRDAIKAWELKNNPGKIPLPELPPHLRRELFDLLRDPSQFNRWAA